MNEPLELIIIGVIAVAIDLALIFFFGITFQIWFISIWKLGLGAIIIGIIWSLIE